MVDYYLRHRGRIRGPYDVGSLRDLEAAGRLPSDVEISEGKEGLYYPLSSMGYLFSASAPPAEVPKRRNDPPGARIAKTAVVAPRTNGDPEASKGDRRDRPAPLGFSLAAALGVMSIAAIVVGFVVDEWLTFSRRVDVGDRGAAVIRCKLGHRDLRFELASGAIELDSATEDLKSKLESRTFAHAERGLKLPTGTFGDSRPDAVSFQQTEVLGLLTPGLLVVGGILSLAAGASAIRPRRVSIPVASGVILFGVLGVATSVALRVMGVATEFQKGATRGDEVLAGPTFFLSVSAGGALVLAFILLLGANARSRSRGRSRRVR